MARTRGGAAFGAQVKKVERGKYGRGKVIERDTIEVGERQIFSG